MVVPPFVPPQIEIPGNVAEERYDVRLGFVKRVAWLYVLSTLAVAGSAMSPLRLNLFGSTGSLIASLVVLSITRYAAKGKHVEQVLSSVFFPLVLLSLGHLLRQLHELGYPVWTLCTTPAAVGLYVLICGRDLSFAGMFFLGFLFQCLAISVVGYWQEMGGALIFESLVVAGAYLFYVVYDLAALQTRRHLGEEVGAVLDLYRDVLNVFTYPVRVVKHWREHRIWSVR